MSWETKRKGANSYYISVLCNYSTERPQTTTNGIICKLLCFNKYSYDTFLDRGRWMLNQVNT